MATFLKLGGSLITDKDIPYSARKQTIKRLGLEIRDFVRHHPNEKLLIGHGSGSFGHAAANEYGTINGVSTPDKWRGFQEVWWAARQLNQIVCELFIEVGLPMISLPASAAVTVKGHKIVDWNIEPIQQCLANGLIPLVYGDAIIDKQLGGTILSTEELFSGLIEPLKASRILLAGKDAGVYRDFPKNSVLLSKITPAQVQQNSINLEKSTSTDVTGGMESKVGAMLQMVSEHPHLSIQIFSGETALNVVRVLNGEKIGTTISAA